MVSSSDTKRIDIEKNAEPLLVQPLSIDPSDPYRASWSSYFAGLAAKYLLTTAILSLIMFGFLKVKIVNFNIPIYGNTIGMEGDCPLDFNKEMTAISDLEFDAPTFSFTQYAEDTDIAAAASLVPVHIVGEIEVRPAKRRLRSKIEVDFTLSAAGDGFPDTALVSGMPHDESSLTLKTPKHLARNTAAGNAAFNLSQTAACGRIHVTVWIAHGVFLEGFNIASESFAITLHPDLDFSTPYTSITTSSGAVSMASGSFKAYDSRNITINSGSNSVTGEYPLYDILSITTISGSIDVEVVPQLVCQNRPQPAALQLSSTSGSVRSRVPTASVPERNYTNFVNSISGGVDVMLLHGNTTTIRTANGAINADIYPYGFNGSRTVIDTRSQSGRVDVIVNPSLSNPLDVFNQMYTNHRSMS
ncbi:MAG: hypothetical protein Q9163_004078, partial [Psora crenata]